jgi:hypothetical protein
VVSAGPAEECLDWWVNLEILAERLAFQGSPAFQESQDYLAGHRGFLVAHPASRGFLVAHPASRGFPVAHPASRGSPVFERSHNLQRAVQTRLSTATNF